MRVVFFLTVCIQLASIRIILSFMLSIARVAGRISVRLNSCKLPCAGNPHQNFGFVTSHIVNFRACASHVGSSTFHRQAKRPQGRTTNSKTTQSPDQVSLPCLGCEIKKRV